jgi:serine phosphatase RsbU (regulator of sigma subunit)
VGATASPRRWLDHAWLGALGGARGRPLGAALVALLVALLLGPEAGPVRALRHAAFDAYQALAPRSPASAPVVIVEIDEPSLARHGQWPWPRTLVARLVDVIARGDPAAIGLDVIMPEPDRLSPGRLAGLVPGLPPDVVDRLARLESSDTALGAALRRAPTVVGVAGLEAPEGGPAPLGRRPPIRVYGGDPAPFVRRFAGVLRSVDEIHGAADGHGLLNPDPGARVVRRVPLVAAVGEALVPAFGIEMLRVASGTPAVSVRVGGRGVESVIVGDLVVPTERDGAVWLHYSRPDPGRFVSAADVLDGKGDSRQFTRKLVLVGVTALGLGDQHATPVAARMAGVEIHAQLLEGIFDGDLLTRPRWAPWAEAAALAAAGLLLVLAVPGRRVLGAAALWLVTAGGMLALGFGLYRSSGLLLDGASLAVGLSLVFVTVLSASLAEAESQRRALRRALQREREAAARLAGELEAARRIQMGSLPQADRAFPGERRFSLHAALEPARVVGGDLYDFFMLGGDRLFFLIGDVSGKGLPGSLFMAVSKSLVKSAALRRPGEVAAVLREANREISRDNAELLFVTALAGVLDAQTGELELCNAGHEAPYLLPAGDGPVRPLAAGGGPPLCAIDDFPYEAAVHRMRPGETLCLVTDGVTEAQNAAGQLYGRTRLERALAAPGREASVEAVGHAIRQDVARFVGEAEPSDDLAILVVRWHGPAVSAP